MKSLQLIKRLKKDTLLILVFHGVVEKSNYQIRNYNRKHLEKDYFFQIISELKKRGSSLSMDQVIYHHKNQVPYPENAFAITFDDGFENNYSIVAPILVDLKIPATFYLTTDFIDNNTMSWIDRIEHCLEGVDSGVLKFGWSKKQWLLNSSKEKIKTLEEIRKQVKQNSDIRADKLVIDIYKQLKMPEAFSSNEPIDKKMNWQQVKELLSNNLFTIGGHTHSHAVLSFLDQNKLKEEVKNSLWLIEEKTGVATIHYSYPEGQAHHYNQKVIDILKENGIKCCPTAINGVNKLNDDLFHLKRVSGNSLIFDKSPC